ncbi:TraB/GumN family protein [Stenotrophomonas pennii]|uniref:TraB/GumN family protein n=1 Tax=Stenotrophomonas lacuserhaii TaxID=2760084 RepID=UPI00320B258B
MQHGRIRQGIGCGATLAALLLLASPRVIAQEVTAAESVVDMAAVQVTGEQPGPGLWKVSNAQGHVLWLLGTVAPLPAGVTWRSDQVQQVIAASDHVLGPPGWTPDVKIGLLRGLTLLPLAMKTARDPQGRTLQQIVAPDAYARWLGLKATYLGRDGGVEKKRPMIASGELYMAFLKRQGLRDSGQVAEALERAYKANRLEPEDARVKLPIDDARAALKELQGTEVDDRACFERTLDTVEFQAAVLRERANAWAAGDIGALRRLAVMSMARTCRDVVQDSAFARSRGWNDLPQRARAQWVGLADKALAQHASTFSTVPVSLLMGPDDYLGALRARGYAIEPPPE